MRQLILIVASSLAALSSATIAQDLPTGQNCAVVRQRITDSVQLALLCSRAIHDDRNVEQADASCRASVELLVQVASDVSVSAAQAPAQRDACTPPQLVSDLRTASDFSTGYLQFRLDGTGELFRPLVL